MANQDKEKSWKADLTFSKGCDLEEGLGRISGLLRKMDVFLSTVAGLGTDGGADLRLVCDEIGSNVVRHSSPSKTTRLEVLIEATDAIIRMRITDDGIAFNPFTQPLPYLGADLDKRRVGGLGLHLIKQLFPLANYQRRDDCNISEVEYHMGDDGKERMRRSLDAHSADNML
jgi:Anti-sigma regulatory factor (Ser/Thr protein kinase)